MRTDARSKLKKVLFNLMGIALVYSVCFCYGRSLGGNAGFHGLPYNDLIAQAARANDIPAALIAAVIHAESNFNPRARSCAGAKGLMQINPPTQRYLRLKDAYDPQRNVAAGSRYLRELLDRFNGHVVMAIAAYNAGPGAVLRHDGIPPYKETQAYVKKVLTYFNLYHSALASNPLMS